jgi:hypothetical protein
MNRSMDTRLEEYKFLRQEHENNRKYVFERPLIIVVGMLTATLSFNGTGADILRLLPILLLAVLWFNLWFTYNRLLSSARIVAYIQLVHETKKPISWIGWESALLAYREWISTSPKEQRAAVRNAPVRFDSFGFYLPTYYFHLLCATLFVALTLMQYGASDCQRQAPLSDLNVMWVLANATALLVFAATLTSYRPSKIRRAIAYNREIWMSVLKPQRQTAVSAKSIRHAGKKRTTDAEGSGR